MNCTFLNKFDGGYGGAIMLWMVEGYGEWYESGSTFKNIQAYEGGVFNCENCRVVDVCATSLGCTNPTIVENVVAKKGGFAFIQ